MIREESSVVVARRGGSFQKEFISTVLIPGKEVSGRRI